MAELGVSLTAQVAQFVEGMNKAAASLKGLEGIAKSVAGSISGYLTISTIKYLAEVGAKVQQTETGFKNATQAMSIDAEKWLKTLKEATRGAVDESDLMQKAMKGLSGGLSEEKITKLAQVATTTAVRMGIETTEAYESIIDAVEMMRSKSLVKLGLITKAQMEIVESAKAAGEQVDMFRIIMENAANQRALIGALDETALKFQQAKAASKDFWDELGKGVAGVVAEIYEVGRNIKDLASKEGREKLQKRADEKISAIAMNETYMPGGQTGPLSSPYTDSLKGAEARKKAAEEAKKQAEAIKKVVENLQFEIEQTQRSEYEQNIYNEVRAAGVSIDSKAGKQIAELAAKKYELAQSSKYAREMAVAESEAWLKQIEEAEKAEKEYAENVVKYQEEINEARRRGNEIASASVLGKQNAQGILASSKNRDLYANKQIDKGQFLTKEYEIRMKNLQAMKDEIDLAATKAESDEQQMAIYKETVDWMNLVNETNATYIAQMSEFGTAVEIWRLQNEELAKFAEAWGLTQEELFTGTVDVWDDLGTMIVDISQQMASSMTNILTGLIMGTVDVKKAIQSLMTSVLATIIGTLVKIGIQYLVTAIIGRGIQAASTAATVASMTAITAAATPAAIMTSIASFGAADVAGMAMFTTALGTMAGEAGALIGLFSGLGAAASAGGVACAEGGIINERVIGFGKSGQMYEIGEAGPEAIVPLSRGFGGGSLVIHIHGDVLNNHDELARKMIPAIRKAQGDGVR